MRIDRHKEDLILITDFYLRCSRFYRYFLVVCRLRYLITCTRGITKMLLKDLCGLCHNAITLFTSTNTDKDAICKKKKRNEVTG